MKRFNVNKKYVGMITAAILTGSLVAGCSATTSDASSGATSLAATSEVSSSGTVESSAKASGMNVVSTQAAGTESTSVTVDQATSDVFTERDMTQTADLSVAKQITLADNQTVDITSEGVYVLSGTAKNATIKVNVAKTEKVQLVLDGVNISNESALAIYIVEADKVFVTTTENSENNLSVSGGFVADGETNTDAVIFSKADLVLNGLGTLVVNSSDNGITSKDDLKVTGGNYVITSSGDALEANELLAIGGGDITIHSQKDGLHAEDNDDNTTGAIFIAGGNLNITATDDGIQGITTVTIDGGNLKISAAEGIESTQVVIHGGVIDIEASDDGINTTEKTTALPIAMAIHGGELNIKMGQGDTDALDSNGDLTITGGNITIEGMSAFDYDGTGTYTGGTLTVNGQTVTELTPSMPGGGFGGAPNGGTRKRR